MDYSLIMVNVIIEKTTKDKLRLTN